MGLEEINGIIMATIVVVVVIGYGGPLLGKTYYRILVEQKHIILK